MCTNATSPKATTRGADKSGHRRPARPGRSAGVGEELGDVGRAVELVHPGGLDGAQAGGHGQAGVAAVAQHADLGEEAGATLIVEPLRVAEVDAVGDDEGVRTVGTYGA